MADQPVRSTQAKMTGPATPRSGCEPAHFRLSGPRRLARTADGDRLPATRALISTHPIMSWTDPSAFNMKYHRELMKMIKLAANVALFILSTSITFAELPPIIPRAVLF